jgi:hypothetical protein
MSKRLEALVRRVVFGSPPGAIATQLEKLRFFQRLYARLGLMMLIGFVFAAIDRAPTFMWVFLGVLTAALLVGCVQLWVHLRRERRQGDG